MSRSIRLEIEIMQHRVSQQDRPGSVRNRELTDLKHQQIVEGAGAVLFAKGFHGASIRDIAAACGMSMGQLYRYISSKDDILYLIHTHSQEIWYQYLIDAGFEDMDDPVDRLESALRLTLRFIAANTDLFQFLYTESKYLDREHLRRVLELDDQNVVGFYRRLLADIPALFVDEDDLERAANLIAFIAVFLALRGWNLDMTDIDEHIEFLVAFVIRGLGVRGNSPSAAGPADGPEAPPARPGSAPCPPSRPSERRRQT